MEKAKAMPGANRRQTAEMRGRAAIAREEMTGSVRRIVTRVVSRRLRRF
jgi:hypothetical protein